MPDDSVPDDAVQVGEVKLGDTGFSVNCGWEIALEKAKEEARKIGGDAIEITEHIPPNFWASSCHRIKATIFKLHDPFTLGDEFTIDTIASDISVRDVETKSADYSRFRVGANISWSYRLGKISEDWDPFLQEYAKELKSGYAYSFDFIWYLNEYMGVGMKYDLFHSTNERSSVTITYPDGTVGYGKMSDDIRIHFLGPLYAMKLENKKKRAAFIMNVGIGYVLYNNDAVIINPVNLKGNTLGLCFDLGYDIYMNENLTLGFQASYLDGLLTSYERSDGTSTETIKLERENYDNLRRIELSAGLRIRF